MPLPLLLAAAASVPLLVASAHFLAAPAPVRSIPDPALLGLPAVHAAAASSGHDLVSPAVAGFRHGTLLEAEAVVYAEIRRGGFPGAALAVGRFGNLVVERGFGRLDWGAGAPLVDADETVYDLASLTKVSRRPRR
jgi:CubicO group peptidase (beta-lactamase class C family)